MRCLRCRRRCSASSGGACCQLARWAPLQRLRCISAGSMHALGEMLPALHAQHANRMQVHLPDRSGPVRPISWGLRIAPGCWHAASSSSLGCLHHLPSCRSHLQVERIIDSAAQLVDAGSAPWAALQVHGFPGCWHRWAGSAPARPAAAGSTAEASAYVLLLLPQQERCWLQLLGANEGDISAV